MNVLWSRLSIAVLAMAAILSAARVDAAQYTYDQLGRLITVVEADGAIAEYTYDANGNILTITRTGATPAVSISSFSPLSGPSGTTVTIRGVGFSSTIAQNTVSINGIPATVTAANASTILAVVPPGASTGAIAVSSPAGAATSSSPFTVTTVTIASFSPSRATPGDTVTIFGTGFDPIPANNIVAFTTGTATVTSASSTQLQVTVPASARSGRISVTTGGSMGVSTSDFFVPNGTHPANDILMTGRLTPGGGGLIYTLGAPGKLGIAVFDAVQGQRVTLVLTNNNLNATFYLYAPDGTLVNSNFFYSSGLLDLPALPATGTYTLVIESTVLPTGGSVTVKLATDTTGPISSDGTPRPVTLASGQNADFTFPASAGESFSLFLTQLTTNPANNGVNAQVLKEDGTLAADCRDYYPWFGSCRFTIAQAGTYRLRLDPQGSHTAAFTLRLNTDVTGTLIPGTPLAITLTKAGQHGRLTFTTDATRTFTLSVDSLDVPMSTNKMVYFDIYNASNVLVTAFGTVGPGYAHPVTDLPAGTYSVVIRPYEVMATATMNVTLALNMPGVLHTDGTPSSFSSDVVGQQANFTFAGTAGQNMSIALTNLIFAPGSGAYYASVTVKRPDGQDFRFFHSYSWSVPGEAVNLDNLPQTGTYSVNVTPGGLVNMSFNLVLTRNVSGTLANGTPYGLNLDKPGRAATLTFTASAGQTVAVHAGSISTTPANSAVLLTVKDAAGLTVGNTATAGDSMTVNLPSLSGGNYSVWISTQNAATATMQVTLADGLVGTLPLGSSATFSTAVPGQWGYFTFNGTAGQRLSLGLTGFSMEPASAGYVINNVYQPSGAWFRFFYGSLSASPGDVFNFGILPATGTYRLEVAPNGAAAAAYTWTLSESVSSVLTTGTPYSLSLSVPGQSAALTFSTPGAQSLTLSVSSIATTPSSKTVWTEVRDSGGALVANSFSVGSAQAISLPSLAAGTYTVLISVADASTATMQVTVSSQESP